MTTEDLESQSGFEESAGGPGAPTPLSALEVYPKLPNLDHANNLGCRRYHETRYPVDGRWRAVHG